MHIFDLLRDNVCTHLTFQDLFLFHFQKRKKIQLKKLRVYFNGKKFDRQ